MGSAIKGLVAALLAVAGSGAHAAAADWTIVDLGTLGGYGSIAMAVSDAGHVVGCADTADGSTHAFIYTNGQMRDLAPDTPPGGRSCALAVNNQGVVAGRFGDELVIWNGSTMTRLGIVGDAADINEAGVIVGSYKPAGIARAFMWVDGRLTNLGTFGGSETDPYNWSNAKAINNRNQIVGAANGKPFLYENGAMRDLGIGSTFAADINDRGQIVGMTSFGQGPAPFLYEGSAQRIESAPSYSSANAINIHGQVVGSAEGSFGYLIDAGQYYRLESLPAVFAKGWRHLEPQRINANGWIVGHGVSPDSGVRAFLLVPKDSPAPAAGGNPAARPPPGSRPTVKARMP